MTHSIFSHAAMPPTEEGIVYLATDAGYRKNLPMPAVLGIVLALGASERGTPPKSLTLYREDLHSSMEAEVKAANMGLLMALDLAEKSGDRVIEWGTDVAKLAHLVDVIPGPRTPRNVMQLKEIMSAIQLRGIELRSRFVPSALRRDMEQVRSDWAVWGVGHADYIANRRGIA